MALQPPKTSEIASKDFSFVGCHERSVMHQSPFFVPRNFLSLTGK